MQRYRGNTHRTEGKKGGRMSVLVELLANPFCLADRDHGTVGDLCQKLGVDYQLLNLWDIDDDMEGTPTHISSLIREYRKGQRPGNLYSNVFVNGKRVLLDRWPAHLEEISFLIQTALEEESE